MNENGRVEKRVKKLFLISLFLLFLSIIYLFMCAFFPNMNLKCIFHEITGFNCPGCGITRMLISFVNFKFINGIMYNVFLGVTFPVVGGIIIYSIYLYIFDKKGTKIFNLICLLYVILLLIWGIVRNIIGI